MSDEPKKYDYGKPRMDLLPADALLEIAKVLTYGAKKYGSHNWAKGIAFSRYQAAALRHLFAYWNGEDNDPETELSHLAHAICSLLFMLTSQIRGLGTDDRIPYSKGSEAIKLAITDIERAKEIKDIGNPIYVDSILKEAQREHDRQLDEMRDLRVKPRNPFASPMRTPVIFDQGGDESEELAGQLLEESKK